MSVRLKRRDLDDAHSWTDGGIVLWQSVFKSVQGKCSDWDNDRVIAHCVWGGGRNHVALQDCMCVYVSRLERLEEQWCTSYCFELCYLSICLYLLFFFFYVSYSTLCRIFPEGQQVVCGVGSACVRWSVLICRFVLMVVVSWIYFICPKEFTLFHLLV